MVTRLLLIVAAGVLAGFAWFRWRQNARKAGGPGFGSMAVWLLSCGLVCRFMLVILTPIGAAPDELAHFKYVTHLMEHGSVPVQTTDVISGAETHDYEYYQPPLYYFILAAVGNVINHFIQPSEGLLLLLLRVFQLSFWGITAAFSYLTARKLLAERPTAAAILLSLAAVLPAYISSSAGINNGNLAIALSSVILYLLLLKRNWSNAFLLGLFCGLALLTKLTAVGVVGLVILLLVWECARAGVRRSSAIAKTAVVLLLLLVLIGPWVLYNLDTYGSLTAESVGNAPNRVIENMPEAARPFWSLGHINHTFWAVAGRKNELTFLPWLSAALGVVLLAGLLARFFSRRQAVEDAALRRWIKTAAVALVLQLALVLRMGVEYGQGQGRFLFPLFAALAVVLSSAVYSLLRLSGLEKRLGPELIPVHSSGLLLFWGLTFSAYLVGVYVG